MKRFALALTCALAGAAPAVSQASLALQIGPNQGADAVDAVVAPGSGEHFFDLTFRETGAPYDEGLLAYDVLVRAPRPGITLLRAEKPDDWVMEGSNAFFSFPEATADHILVSVGSPQIDRLFDITDGKKAARVYYHVDAGTPPGLYHITLDPDYTGIASGHPERALPPPVGVTDPGVIRVTPEPAGLGLLAAGGALALRRGRVRRPYVCNA